MTTRETSPSGGRTALGVLAWLWVLVPFGWGLVQLIGKIPALFGS